MFTRFFQRLKAQAAGKNCLRESNDFLRGSNSLLFPGKTRWVTSPEKTFSPGWICGGLQKFSGETGLQL
jgi:hypothetical protein